MITIKGSLVFVTKTAMNYNFKGVPRLVRKGGDWYITIEV